MAKDSDSYTIAAPPSTLSGPPSDWKFYDLREGKDKNELDSNLTELAAAPHFFEKGYAAHRDWLGHINRFMAVARKVHVDKTKLLDVGCGRFGLPYTLNQGRRQPGLYWGLDLRASELWGKRLQWRSPSRLVKMDLILDDPTELLDWPAEGFDLVTCFEVLEHVPRINAPTLMQNLFNWTAPGGLCMFSTPNYGPSTSVAKNHIGPDGEIREWAYDDKVKMAEAAGFEIEGAAGIFIRMDRVPPEALDNEIISAAKRMLSNEWFSVLAAAAFPAESNNALFFLRRPK